MPRSHRISRISAFALVWAAVAGLVLAVAAPAGAESAASARRRRDQARAKKAQLAQKIDALKASDSDLEKALAALSTQVQTQQARRDAARQALDAAEAQRVAAEQRLAQTENDIATTRAGLVSRAVSAYVQPQGDGTAGDGYLAAASGDLGEMSRRAALLNQIAGRDQDALDRMHALQQDLTLQQDTANKAKALAEQRRKLEEQSLSELRQALSAKQKLQDAVEARIKDYQQEADAVAAQETSLSSLIRSKETVATASRGADDGAVAGRISGAGLIWPVSGPVTSGFGYRWGRLHAGIDIAVGIGTPIHAAKAGTVIFSGQMSGYGGVVIIDHGGGFSTLYAHQSRPAASEGQQVAQGEVIGYSGNTGHSTGPHLHFETRVNGSPQNPRQYL
jgi:murein DD-endopeptidase MepM/ murein hydrolase activator NlpD